MLPPPSRSVLSPSCVASGLRCVLADNLWLQAIDIDGDGTLDSQEVRRLLLDLGREATDLDEAALALAMAEMRGGGGGKTPVTTHASSSSRHGRWFLMAAGVFCADQSGAVRAVVVAAQGGRHFNHARRRRQKLDRDLCSLWQEEEAKPCAPHPLPQLPLRRS